MNMEKIMEWSQGNPGALTFIMELMNPANKVTGFNIITHLSEMKSIRGTNLYVLWSDLCNRDINKVEKLCIECPRVILEDACSRQDYSGRELVSEFLNK